MKHIGRVLAFLAATMLMPLCISAQTIQPQVVPQLEFVMQLRVTIGQAYSVGETAHGRRVVIPITGGAFEGPRLRGSVVSGGADYQLVRQDMQRTELEAIYDIRTDDGTHIHVRNRGLISDGGSYFRTAPHFETDATGPYAWLNNAIFVCAPDFSTPFSATPEGKDGSNGVILNVWMVK